VNVVRGATDAEGFHPILFHNAPNKLPQPLFDFIVNKGAALFGTEYEVEDQRMIGVRHGLAPREFSRPYGTFRTEVCFERRCPGLKRPGYFQMPRWGIR
jgi:hypothetical protein